MHVVWEDFIPSRGSCRPRCERQEGPARQEAYIHTFVSQVLRDAWCLNDVLLVRRQCEGAQSDSTVERRPMNYDVLHVHDIGG